jgi:hypothetical protein
VLRYGDLCVLCLVGTGLLQILNLCFEGSEVHRWYQLHLLFAPQASVVDNEMSVLEIRSNFYALVCLVGVSEENSMRYIEDFPKSCPATHRYVERCRLHLFGRYPRRITSVTLSSVAWLSPLEFRVSALKLAVIPSYQITVRYSGLHEIRKRKAN